MSPDQGAIYAVAAEILDCVAIALDQTPYGAPERACVAPGVAPAFFNCCSNNPDGSGGGQLTVNVVRQIDTNAFPNISIAGGGVVGSAIGSGNCPLAWTVVEYLVTTVRCTPIIRDNNRYPTCEQLDRSAKQLLSDFQQVRHGLKCCLYAMDKRVHPWAMGESLSLGPDGGCAGNTVTAFIGFPNCRPCDDSGG